MHHLIRKGRVIIINGIIHIQNRTILARIVCKLIIIVYLFLLDQCDKEAKKRNEEMKLCFKIGETKKCMTVYLLFGESFAHLTISSVS